VYLILGFRSPRDFIFREELEAVQSRYRNLSVTATISNPGSEAWGGKVGRIGEALLTECVPDIARRRAHVCGPPSMMEQVKRLLLNLGMNQAAIKTEAFGTVTRDPRMNKGRSAAIAGTVTFLASDARRPVPEDATILDVADKAGVFIDNACRSGTCASCRVKLTSGRVSMAVQDALTEQDKADGYILACQAKIHGDVTVNV
jgi:ferredoxin-NADP reductase